MRLGRGMVLFAGMMAAACSPTIGPVVSSVQVLVVLDSLESVLRIIPVDSPGVVHTLAINHGGNTLAVHGQIAALGFRDTVQVVDLALRHTVCAPKVAVNGPITALVFDELGKGYAAIQSENKVTQFDPSSPPNCGGSEARPPGRPQAFGIARNFVFVAVGDELQCGTGSNECPSWLSTFLQVRDSIPLSGPGNAKGAVMASDGLLYVINAGAGNPNARLSQVDPVQKVETASFGGFGRSPIAIATDGVDRVFVASAVDGLMVFNVRSRQVERGPLAAVAGVPLNNPRGLVVDDLGRIFALQGGSCTGTGARGIVRVFGADLVEHNPSVTVGRCPVAIGVTDIPAALYRFDN